MRVEGESSGWEEVSSGVVQGSVLGGTLFNIFIDDIDEAAEGARVWKFADDTKAARVVESAEDGEEMQRMIERLAEWADTWGMEFNAKKCKVMHCGRRNPHWQYLMKGEVIEAVKEERD